MLVKFWLASIINSVLNAIRMRPNRKTRRRRASRMRSLRHLLAAAALTPLLVASSYGDGTFAAQVAYTVGDRPLSVTTGDFNGDGFTDLATANRNSYDVSVLLGVGDGTFAPQATYAVGSRGFRGSKPYFVTSGDFNGDGFTDLATANYCDFFYGHMSVLLAVGDGTFAAQATYAVGDRPTSVTTGDFNGDGFTDLATANSSAEFDQVSVRLGVGDGTFATDQTYAAGGSNSITTGDFNGDGFTDLATAGGVDDVSVLLNQCRSDVLIGDVNLDGVVDLLDVQPFVDLLNSGDFQAEADINQDGAVTLLDVDPFVALLSGG